MRVSLTTLNFWQLWNNIPYTTLIYGSHVRLVCNLKCFCLSTSMRSLKQCRLRQKADWYWHLNKIIILLSCLFRFTSPSAYNCRFPQILLFESSPVFLSRTFFKMAAVAAVESEGHRRKKSEWSRDKIRNDKGNYLNTQNPQIRQLDDNFIQASITDSFLQEIT